MKIFVTGIRGNLGSRLAASLRTRGHQVRGSSSTADDLPRIRLGEPFDAAVFGDADILIHAAHDLRRGAGKANIEGGRMVLNASGGRRSIFLSSHSARPDAVSEYGISKYAVEQFFLGAGQTVVRPGLVIGAGGLFGRQLASLRRSRVIPLVDAGRDAIPVLAMADFCAAMERVVDELAPRAYNLFNSVEPTMREIVETALRLLKRRAWLVPVPLAVAAVAARFLPLGSPESLRLNRTRVHESQLRELLPRESSLEEAIRAAIEEK